MTFHGLINLGLLPRLLEAMEAPITKAFTGLSHLEPHEKAHEKGCLGRVAHPGTSKAH